MENIRSTEIFVSSLCPHCQELIKDYKNNPEKYEGSKFLNITENLGSLKRFLKYRDDLKGYEEIKAAGKIGVPSKVLDGARVEFFKEV